MSSLGQKRRFVSLPAISGLPQSRDIARLAQLVRLVPEADLTGPNDFARLKRASGILSCTMGLVNFNSLSVSEAMVRFSAGLPVRVTNVLAGISRPRTLFASSNE
jgi:hypothetical protein